MGVIASLVVVMVVYFIICFVIGGGLVYVGVMVEIGWKLDGGGLGVFVVGDVVDVVYFVIRLVAY